MDVSYRKPDQAAKPSSEKAPSATPPPASSNGSSHDETILSPLEGKFYLTKDSSEKALKKGDEVKKGDTICYIEAMKVYNAITADKSGTIVEIVPTPGESVEEDDVLIRLH